ncbi:ABC transporter substrate-binding protein [Marichromatium bheemlicum]|uniref:ABC transporter substrate-binding protein n=1 Tax=Marichromatium bheemlicum TaxID=365339 RepID=A0ABX1I7Y1_9GAMM|nr:ABC transporter substrate-binding protein [Marichromatium bheemlicum]NKN32337.1 ABC transporter substrate-binding protein [Marichromatium bheemlicum]
MTQDVDAKRRHRAPRAPSPRIDSAPPPRHDAALSPRCSRRRLLGLLATALTLPAWRQAAGAPAQRLLAIGSGALRLLTYLGAVERLVGIEDVERRALTTSSYRYALPASIQRLPSIGPGGPGRMPDLEQVLRLQPDLIAAATLDDQQRLTLRQRTGVALMPLSYGDTGILRIDDLLTSLRLLGAALGRERRAAELTTTLTDELAMLRQRVAHRPPVAAYLGGVSMQGSHGLTSTQSAHRPLRWAGAHNLADRAGPDGHLFIDREQLLFWDPPVLFIDGAGLAGILTEYAKDPGLYRQLRAVRDGQVWLTLPFNAYNTNVENALVNAWMMAKVLHPEALADIDIGARASAIMRAFLGTDIMPALAEHGYGLGRLDLEQGRWTPLS